MVDRAVSYAVKETDPPVEFIPNKFYVTRYNLVLYVTDKPASNRTNGVIGYWATAWSGIEENSVSKDDLVAYATRDDILTFYYLFNYRYTQQIDHLRREIERYSTPLRKWNKIITDILGKQNDKCS